MNRRRLIFKYTPAGMCSTGFTERFDKDYNTIVLNAQVNDTRHLYTPSLFIAIEYSHKTVLSSG